MAKQSMNWDDLLKNLTGAGKGVSGSGDAGGAGGGNGGARWSAPNMLPAASKRWEGFLKTVRKLLVVFIILVVLIVAGCYWWFHPPINIHSEDTWGFVFIVILLPAFLTFRYRKVLWDKGNKKHVANTKKAKTFKWLSYIPVVVTAAILVGAIASSVIIPGNAERYASVLKTETSDFATDIKEVNYDQIPIIDRASAAKLGQRVMGSIPELVSQFEVSNIYSQINYQGHPVRVSPLNYADFFKWFNQRNAGVPGYVTVDMTTQNAQLVHSDQPIYYNETEPFERNIARHVQLSYPFYMFDEISFEIDETGKPWWICPVQTRTIGLFGGRDIVRVVLVDANNGECTDFAVEDTPQWVDRVYPAEVLLEQYNWYGSYNKGWLNSWIGQESVVETTPGANGLPGYNYIAKDDDVWVYTGVTSVVSDNSIVGFVLVNQRTKESHYYAIYGATEDGAMSSAEGQVADLRYTATFPLLLNINGYPTYFMALKDAEGLVKKYAMLDIQRYQNVAVGDTVAGTQQTYQALLITNGGKIDAEEPASTLETTGIVERIATAVVEGNSHFYVTLKDDDRIYDCAMPGIIDVLQVAKGDKVKLIFVEAKPISSVSKLERL